MAAAIPGRIPGSRNSSRLRWRQGGVQGPIPLLVLLVQQMRHIFTKRTVLPGFLFLFVLTAASLVNAWRVAGKAVGIPGASAVPLFTPWHHGRFSPGWWFTYWSEGETSGIIAEVRVSLFGEITYRKNYRGSGSTAPTVDKK